MIPKRISAALLHSMTAGVTPRTGLPYIAIGRQGEIRALVGDLDNIEAGGSAFRLICGRYGSGKSFLLGLVRGNAMDRGFAVMDADLSPERRLTGTRGQGLAHLPGADDQSLNQGLPGGRRAARGAGPLHQRLAAGSRPGAGSCAGGSPGWRKRWSARCSRR